MSVAGWAQVALLIVLDYLAALCLGPLTETLGGRLY